MIKQLIGLGLLCGTSLACANTFQEQVECLTQNIYHEARGESIEGQYAVGLVTLNRVYSDKFPRRVNGVSASKSQRNDGNICHVVRDAKFENGRVALNACQFSWYCDGKSDKMLDKHAKQTARKIAIDLIINRYFIEDFTHNALHYHKDTIEPAWSAVFEVSTIIDQHIFYN